MSTTNQLPEPELGYIQTDKSNQPAFSARQMREAMGHATTEPVGEIKWAANVPNSIREAVFYDLMPPIGTKLYTAPQPAQATQAEVTDGIRPEDFTVDVVVKPMGGFAPVNTQGVRVTHKPTGISVTCDAARGQHMNRHQAFEKLRAILALRPERVPMTREQMIEAVRPLCVSQETAESLVKISFDEYQAIEAFHNIGITAQAKKETP